MREIYLRNITPRKSDLRRTALREVKLKVYVDATAGAGGFGDCTTLGLVVLMNGTVNLRSYKRTKIKEQHIVAAELLALLHAFAYLIENRKKLFGAYLPDSFCYAEDACRVEIPFSVCSDNSAAVLICNRIFASEPLKGLQPFVTEKTIARIERFHRIFPAAAVNHVPGRLNLADAPSRGKFR